MSNRTVNDVLGEVEKLRERLDGWRVASQSESTLIEIGQKLLQCCDELREAVNAEQRQSWEDGFDNGYCAGIEDTEKRYGEVW